MESHQFGLAQRRSLRDNKRKCPMCLRTFSKTEHLERHIRSHTKEKPFECQQCGRKYGRSDSLLRHTKDLHKNTPSNEPHNSRASQALPSNGEGIMNQALTDQDVGTTTSNHDTGTEIPVMGGNASDISMAAYHSQPHQINQFQPTSEAVTHWDQSHGIPDIVLPNDQQASLSFDNWLTYVNLDENFLRNWPFVIDNSDLGRASGHTPYSSREALADLRQSWYTSLDKENAILSGYTTPLPGENQEVDENYIHSIQSRLQIRVPNQRLPSADYLNLCVTAYFKRFHPVFPIIHAATFRPSKTNAVLLLSMCSIGSLLTGHPSAVQKGIQLFERLNKAILSNWETLMHRSPDENFAMLQAAVIGQTFGMLSGQAKHLVLVDTFHGTIIAWARRAKIFQDQHRPFDDQQLESRWVEWVRTEERIRLALAVRIHDAEIAGILHHETFLPLTSKQTPIAERDALFFATNPQDWMALYREGASHLATPSAETPLRYAKPEVLYEHLVSIPVDCHFSIYSVLEDILSEIMEVRINETLTHQYVYRLHSCLVEFHRQYLQGLATSQLEALQGGIKILWHFLFISLHADFDLLEKAVGRDGPELNPSDLARIREWASSADAKRTVAHAIMIKRNLEDFPLTSEPALHVPRVIFLNAVCLFCYSKYGGGAGEEHLNFPEFQLFDVSVAALLREADGWKRGKEVDLDPLYGFVDLLQRIGHWEISRKFALILGVLIQAESS